MNIKVTPLPPKKYGDGKGAFRNESHQAFQTLAVGFIPLFNEADDHPAGIYQIFDTDVLLE